MTVAVNPGSPTLVFVPEGGDWLVADGEDLRRIEGETDMLVVASYLPVRIGSGTTLGRVRGSVRVAENDASGCRLAFADLALRPDRPDLRVEPRPFSGGMARWTQGTFSDGWLACDTELLVENVASLSARFYLPERADPRQKLLGVFVEGHPIHEQALRRGKLTELSLDLADYVGRRRRLVLRCSHPEPDLANGDRRQLGCIIVDLAVNGGPFQPFAYSE